MSQQPFDAGIPILTEVIDDAPPVETPAAPSYAQPWQAVTQVAPEAQEAPARPAPAPAPVSEAEWAVLESRLSNRIVQQLQVTIEQHIRDSLAPLLSLAVQQLSGQLGQQLGSELRSGLQDTVERAVAQEITHLQAQKK